MNNSFYPPLIDFLVTGGFQFLSTLIAAKVDEFPVPTSVGQGPGEEQGLFLGGIFRREAPGQIRWVFLTSGITRFYLLPNGGVSWRLPSFHPPNRHPNQVETIVSSLDLDGFPKQKRVSPGPTTRFP